MRVVVAAGAVVTGFCSQRIPGVCQWSHDTAGPVLVYHDHDTGQEIHACRACANQMYATHEWVRPGEESEGGDERLLAYLREIRGARTNEQKNAVFQSFARQRWGFQIPLSAGEELDGVWVANIMLGQFGWVKVAIYSNDYCTPAVVEVRPPRDLDEHLRADEAIFFVTRELA
ncbi:MAG: hypothetical protein R6V85_09195 [Polyangia bacterium]